MIQRILQNAVVLGTRTVRCHRNNWHHVAVAVIVVDDDVVVVVGVARWRGYRDGVVVPGIEMIVVVGSTTGRSISVAQIV